MNSYGNKETVCKDSEVPTIITDGKTVYNGKDYPVHTNGPWARDNFALSIDITSRKGIVATVGSQNCDCPEEMRANARLIAAAPEMLEVLRWLDAEMDCRDDDLGAVLFSRGDFEIVRQTINLAMNGDINESTTGKNKDSKQRRLKMIDFLKHHDACEEGVEWARSNCSTLMDCWNKAKPEWLIWLATREGVLTDRELHKFSLWSANQVRHLMTDPRSTAALDAKRKWLEGKISDNELREAEAAAWAVWSAAWAARAAADAAVWATADAAVWPTAWDAARVGARERQAAWLRENTKPNFGEAE